MRASVYWRSLVQGSVTTMSRVSRAMARLMKMGEGALEGLGQAVREPHLSFVLLVNAHRLQPVLEFRRGLETQHLAHVERIMERGRLIVEHDVVGTGNAHDVVDASDSEQRHQHVHVVLI